MKLANRLNEFMVASEHSTQFKQEGNIAPQSKTIMTPVNQPFGLSNTVDPTNSSNQSNSENQTMANPNEAIRLTGEASYWIYPNPVELPTKEKQEESIKKGINYCNQALEHDVNYAFAYYCLGEGYCALGQAEKAIINYIKAINLNSQELIYIDGLKRVLDNAEQLEKISKAFIFDEIKKLPKEIAIPYLKQAVDPEEKTILSKRFHKHIFLQDGISISKWTNSSKVDKDILNDICNYIKNNDPTFSVDNITNATSTEYRTKTNKSDENKKSTNTSTIEINRTLTVESTVCNEKTTNVSDVVISNPELKADIYNAFIQNCDGEDGMTCKANAKKWIGKNGELFLEFLKNKQGTSADFIDAMKEIQKRVGDLPGLAMSECDLRFILLREDTSTEYSPDVNTYQWILMAFEQRIKQIDLDLGVKLEKEREKRFFGITWRNWNAAAQVAFNKMPSFLAVKKNPIVESKKDDGGKTFQFYDNL